jgi:hypothetical protein
MFFTAVTNLSGFWRAADGIPGGRMEEGGGGPTAYLEPGGRPTTSGGWRLECAMHMRLGAMAGARKASSGSWARWISRPAGWV